MTSITTIPGDTAVRVGIADGLRAFADEYAADDRLPLARGAHTLGLTINIGVADPELVHKAAAAQDAAVEITPAGHTTTDLLFGAVTVHVYHVPDRDVALYAAEQSYAANIAATRTREARERSPFGPIGSGLVNQ